MRYVFCILGLLLALSVHAQTHCDGVRYIEPVFSEVDSTIGIQYGSNVTIGGQQRDLFLDVYYPTEFFFARPLIVVAHGGSFVSGTRKYLRPLCLEFAARGYVVASIDYRLYDAFAIPFDSVVASDVAIKATMDMKAAIRWFRQNAKTANDFGIDTNLIFSGGISAGAIIALHGAYLDPADYQSGSITDSIVQNNGGIRGNSSNNHQFSDDVMGVLNYSGALKDARWIDPSEPMVFSAHDEFDDVVPYGRDITMELGSPVELWGSAEVHKKAKEDGIRSQLITIEGSTGHVSYFLDNPSEKYDLVVDSSCYFLEYAICDRISEVDRIPAVPPIKLFPNPATSHIHVSATAELSRIFIKDGLGKVVLTSTDKKVISVESLPMGIYHVEAIPVSGSPWHGTFIKP